MAFVVVFDANVLYAIALCDLLITTLESQLYRVAAAAIEPKSNVRPATSARVASYLRVQIMPAFTDVSLCKISRLSVQTWVDAMTQTLAPRTVRDSYRVFAGFMREAERQGLIRRSPCYSIVLPRMPRPEPRFLTPKQVERLAAAIDARFAPLIYAGAYLGLRWSELAGLKRTNLDLTARRLSVVGALGRVGSGWRYSEQLKTSRSRRTLLIPQFIVDLLADELFDGAGERVRFLLGLWQHPQLPQLSEALLGPGGGSS